MRQSVMRMSVRWFGADHEDATRGCPANGVTFCTDSLGAAPSNDCPAMITALAGRIDFVHARNVRVTGGNPAA